MSGDSVQGSLSITILGSTAFAWGLRTWKKKRLIENLPSAKVKSAAQGLVELRGQARPWKPQVSPVSGESCCWWRYEIQEYRRSGKSSHWVTIHEMESPLWFFLEDSTGRMLIDPATAEIMIKSRTWPLDTALRTRMGSGLGVSAGSSFFGLSFANRQRVIETLLREQSPVYVLGHLSPRSDVLTGRRERLHAKLRALKSSPEVMKAADTNRDGQVDTSEWNELRKRAESQFLEDEQARAEDIPVDERFVVRAPTEYPYIIAEGDERSILGPLAWMAPFGVLGGAALCGTGVWMSVAAGHALWLSALLVVGGWALGILMSTKKKGGFSWRLSVWS